MDAKTIARNFTYKSPNGDQPKRYEDLRENAKILAFKINSICPEGREKSIAMAKLEESVMWANASIAREDKPCLSSV